MYDFFTLKNMICMFFLFVAVISLFVPHRIIDTRHCKQNWVVILIILASCSFMIDHYLLGLVLLSILIVYPLLSAMYGLLQANPSDKQIKYDQSHKKG